MLVVAPAVVAAVVLGAWLVASLPGASAAVTATPSASMLLSAMDPTAGAGATATWVSAPLGSATAVSTTGLAAFPVQGPSFAILSTGDATAAPGPSVSPGTTTDHGGGPVRGTRDHDVLILRIDFVACEAGTVSFQYGFLTEEYPEYVGSAYRDTFVAEMDALAWTTDATGVSTPGAFVVADVDDPWLQPSYATGTTYDAGTSTFPYQRTAWVDVTAGAHTLYLSLFDVRDGDLDSTVFLDGLTLPCCDDTMPPSPPMAAPGSPSASGASPITVTWARSLHCVKSYNVYRREVTLTYPPAPIGSVPAPTTTYVDTTADPCKTYEYRITAVRVLESAPTTDALAGWRRTHAPGGLSGTVNPSTGDVALAWSSPDDCITEYHLTRWPTGAPLATVPHPTRTYTDPGIALMEPCLAYAVVSHNHLALPPHTDPSDAAPWSWVDPALHTPLVLNLTDGPGAGGATLDWTPHMCPSGYVVERRDTPTGPFVSIASLGANTTHFVDLGLQPCSTYTYRVQAYLRIPAPPEPSNAQSVTKPIQPPGPPSGTTITGSNLTWSDSPPVPCRADHYVVSMSLDGGATWTDIRTLDHPNHQTVLDLLGGCGATMTFRVRADNAAGDSANDVAVTWTAPPIGLPPNPPGPLTGSQGDGWQYLSWGASPPNGCPVTGYDVYRRPNALAPFPAAPQNEAPLTSPWWAERLPGCQSFEYVVVAVNANGTSGPSNVLDVTTPLQPPNAPQSLAATADEQAHVTWLPPEPNGCPVDGYHVLRRALWYGTNSGPYQDAAWTTALQVDDQPPEGACAFTYTVAAFNAAGEGPHAPAATVAMPVHAPDAPRLCTPAFDTDGDGVQDAADDCPAVPDRAQADRDGDGLGDACDAQPATPDLAAAPPPLGRTALDTDRDGVADTADVCPHEPDADQADLDRDHVGDLCDPDVDGDGVPEEPGAGSIADDCPRASDPAQADTDGDGLGDACDPQPGTCPAWPAPCRTGSARSTRPDATLSGTGSAFPITFWLGLAAAFALASGLAVVVAVAATRRGRRVAGRPTRA